MIPAGPSSRVYFREKGSAPSESQLFGTSPRLRRPFANYLSLLLAAVLIAGCGVISGNNAPNGGTGTSETSPPANLAAIKISQFATLRQVEAAVRRAQNAKTPPSHVAPSLEVLADNGDFGDSQSQVCPSVTVNISSVNTNDCIFGDTQSHKTIVLTGDSRAQMWFNAIDAIATASKYRLVFLAKSGCPVPLATYRINSNGSLTNSPWIACSAWHKFIASTINSLAPQLVIVSSSASLDLAAPAHVATPMEETSDMLSFLHTLPSSAKIVVIGGFPQPGATLSPTLCLSKNSGDIGKCSYKPSQDVLQANAAIKNAARDAGVKYVNQKPWLCRAVCPAVIADIIPYTIDGFHIDNTYAQYLTGVLWASLKPDLK